MAFSRARRLACDRRDASRFLIFCSSRLSASRSESSTTGSLRRARRTKSANSGSDSHSMPMQSQPNGRRRLEQMIESRFDEVRPVLRFPRRPGQFRAQDDRPTFILTDLHQSCDLIDRVTIPMPFQYHLGLGPADHPRSFPYRPFPRPPSRRARSCFPLCFVI